MVPPACVKKRKPYCAYLGFCMLQWDWSTGFAPFHFNPWQWTCPNISKLKMSPFSVSLSCWLRPVHPIGMRFTATNLPLDTSFLVCANEIQELQIVHHSITAFKEPDLPNIRPLKRSSNRTMNNWHEVDMIQANHGWSNVVDASDSVLPNVISSTLPWFRAAFWRSLIFSKPQINSCRVHAAMLQCQNFLPYTVCAYLESGLAVCTTFDNLTCSLRKVMPWYDQSSTGLRLRPGNLQSSELGDTTPFGEQNGTLPLSDLPGGLASPAKNFPDLLCGLLH